MNTKTFTAVAALCLAALTLGPSPASGAAFQADEYPTTVIGEQLGFGTSKTPGESGTILAFEGHMTECGSAGFEGVLTASSSQLTVQPGGVGCVAFGFLGGGMAMNGCDYRLNVGSGSEDSYTGTVDFVCPAGSKMVVTGGNCEVQIGSQSGLGTVSYENLTAESPDRLRVNFNVSKFTYTKTKDGFGCPLNGAGVAADGVLVGGTKAFATSGGEFVGLRIG